MSSLVLFHKLNEINWKIWSFATLATVLAATISLANIGPAKLASSDSTNNQAKQAMLQGHYRPARRLADIALLRARISRDKKELIDALLTSSQIDSEFEEYALSDALAREAVELTSSVYGKQSTKAAEAMTHLADVLADPDQAIKLYKEALSIYKKQSGENSVDMARVLVELAKCYQDNEETGAAISATRAAIKIFKSSPSNEPAYARALVLYAQLADLDELEKLKLLKTALSSQEHSLGTNHPELSSTLIQLAAEETAPETKEGLLTRAIQIDYLVFGEKSVQLARDLTAMADFKESLGKKHDSMSFRNQAAKIFKERESDPSAKMSCEFLRSYGKLLRDLKLDKEAAGIDSIFLARKKELKEIGDDKMLVASKTSEEQDNSDMESDPEYWQRVELVPIEAVKNFASDDYDHIQVWYQKGELKLEAFKQGEIVFQDSFAECPTGIVNLSADQNRILVSWRDGDGPIWHDDNYQIGKNLIKLLNSSTSDAYVLQIKEQLDNVLSGDPEALSAGAVESVPSSYINNNLICDSIKKGENKALKLYGDGDASTAAERLAMVFDFTVKAINSQRNEINQQLTRQQAWIDAWTFQGLPLSDYIGALNDYGFFLQQNGCLKESASVLLLVTELSPQRAIAHLNLADSFWKLGQASEAQKNYQTYITLMKETKDERQIPTRVLHRIAQKSGSAEYRIKKSGSAGYQPASILPGNASSSLIHPTGPIPGV